jgi:hypothetical protein
MAPLVRPNQAVVVLPQLAVLDVKMHEYKLVMNYMQLMNLIRVLSTVHYHINYTFNETGHYQTKPTSIHD